PLERLHHIGVASRLSTEGIIMIVEAVDGFYYKDPVVEFDKWILEIKDEPIIKRNSRWPTARKYLKGAGVKCTFVRELTPDSTILKGRLVKVSCFLVKLNGPIPVPKTYDGKFTFTPEKSDDLLSWS